MDSSFKKKFSLVALILLQVFFVVSCHEKSANTMFRLIAPGHSGVYFNNKVLENDSINPLDLEFLYNGGGVAAEDFNNDGLPDLYFTASTGSNKLYLNRGNFIFDDVTEVANVTGEGRWCNGVAVTDINNDGLPDMYICTTIKKNPAERTSLLYVNQGLDKKGIPVFKEMARDYGLADTGYSVQAVFFDYDNDGDLDMYLLNTKLAKREGVRFSSNNIDNDHSDFDKLYRNDWNEQVHHPVYTDVSEKAGINLPGYGLGVAVADINKDGWPDIYVSNDFYRNDVLYINNRDGTFTNKISQCLKHTSQNSMGIDIADINNDGLEDLLTVDMNPADNLRKKTNMGGSNYNVYQNMMLGGYTLQYVRNMLQLNLGPAILPGDSVGEPVFGDIGFYTGTAETDWSWNPSIADLDNDGNRDILITNGYPRDVTDHDFAAFRAHSSNSLSKKNIISQIPQVEISNYAFHNKGNLQFENITESWGLDRKSFSNGAVCVDLDNDGDLDYVVNNINREAFVYENTIISKDSTSSGANYLDILFKGDKKNLQGIGAVAALYYGDGQTQISENNPCRGYLSTIEAKVHFGLNQIKVIDSIIINWPGGRRQLLSQVAVNQVLKLNIQDADSARAYHSPLTIANSIFSNANALTGITYTHKEDDYIDFNNERLLPHKLSQYGPGLAAGDIDGNGLDDIFVGGARNFPGKYFLQQPNGKFVAKELTVISPKDGRIPENMGILLFDADGDGDLDAYCTSGSNEFLANTKNYQDYFFVNDGKGNFFPDNAAIPVNCSSKSCIKAADFDNDGDLDLFIGGRVVPGQYPMPAASHIFRNDSKPGNLLFTDVTDSVAKGMNTIGMVCDAIWTDFDNDGWTDLILTGEWMGIMILKNNHGHLENVSKFSGINNATGWWNSIVAGDFDNDGDIDYIVGNLGQNAFYRASNDYPLAIYAGDFDNNKTIDAITTFFLPDQNGRMREYPSQNRDDIVEQLPILKKRFLTYKDFGRATIHELLTPDQIKNSQQLHANHLTSDFMENLGNGKFRLRPLPPLAQLSPIFGMVADDFNDDGNLDIALSGNDYGTEVTNGRNDTFNGLVLSGDGKGNFSTQSILKSGLYIPGNGKALIKLRGFNNSYLLAASQNRGPLLMFKKNVGGKIIQLLPTDKTATYTFKDGRFRKEELYFGNSFNSQSSRIILWNRMMDKVEVADNKGRRRIVSFR